MAVIYGRWPIRYAKREYEQANLCIRFVFYIGICYSLDTDPKVFYIHVSIRGGLLQDFYFVSFYFFLHLLLSANLLEFNWEDKREEKSITFIYWNNILYFSFNYSCVYNIYIYTYFFFERNWKWMLEVSEFKGKIYFYGNDIKRERE